MTTYFNGWRRKLGVVTLVMACASAVMWVRSEFAVDYLQLKFPANRPISMVCSSLFGGLELVAVTVENPTSPPSLTFGAMRLNELPDYDVIKEGRWLISIRKSEAGTFEGIQNPATIFAALFPYWTITLSLGLLSACMLLSKARLAKPT